MNWENETEESSSSARVNEKKSVPTLGLLLVLAIFAAAAWLADARVREERPDFRQDLRQPARRFPSAHSSFALGVTFVNYAVILVSYDYLAFASPRCRSRCGGWPSPP